MIIKNLLKATLLIVATCSSFAMNNSTEDDDQEIEEEIDAYDKYEENDINKKIKKLIASKEDYKYDTQERVKTIRIIKKILNDRGINDERLNNLSIENIQKFSLNKKEFTTITEVFLYKLILIHKKNTNVYSLITKELKDRFDKINKSIYMLDGYGVIQNIALMNRAIMRLKTDYKVDITELNELLDKIKEISYEYYDIISKQILPYYELVVKYRNDTTIHTTPSFDGDENEDSEDFYYKKQSTEYLIEHIYEELSNIMKNLI